MLACKREDELANTHSRHFSPPHRHHCVFIHVLWCGAPQDSFVENFTQKSFATDVNIIRGEIERDFVARFSHHRHCLGSIFAHTEPLGRLAILICNMLRVTGTPHSLAFAVDLAQNFDNRSTAFTDARRVTLLGICSARVGLSKRAPPVNRGGLREIRNHHVSSSSAHRQTVTHLTFHQSNRSVFLLKIFLKNIQVIIESNSIEKNERQCLW